MSKFFTIVFSALESEQLVSLLTLQTVISSENANRLIEKLKFTSPVDAGVEVAEGTDCPVIFDPADLDQLLQVLYLQTSIPDDQAISLIAKINRIVHQKSTLRGLSRNLLTNANLDLVVSNATETYYRYREKRFLPEPIRDQNDLLSSESSDLNPLNTIAKTLESIAQTLEAIVPHLPPPHSQSLGFTNHYRKNIIYCEAKQGSYWHLRNEWQQTIAIHGRALTCIPQALELLDTETAEPTLHLHVQADKLYCLEVPSKGLFTTKLLMAIVQLSPSQLQRPITIEPFQLADSHELTCQVYYQGTPLADLSDIPPPLPRLIQAVQIKLNQASTGHF